ncbi:MAG: PLP-dependent aminotransferase family protein [Candidatus Nezhaarchaeales archaeon]
MSYERFLAGRANLIEASPIRVAVAKIAELTDRGFKVISLAAGDPDPDVIPRRLLAQLMLKVLDDPRSVIYAPTQGWPNARRAIAEFYGKQYGLNVSSDNIIITTGGEQALDLVPRVLCDPGDVVVLENPSYTNAILCWKHYAVQMVGVPMDDNGMRMDLLEETLKRLKSEGKRVKFVYTVTPGNNPSGITLSEDRGKYLLELASKYDFLVFEDAAYLPLQYGARLKPLISMDKDGRVIHESTASKIMGTGWRTGWLIAKGEVFEKSLQAKMPMDMCAPSPSQLLFEELIVKGYVYDVINVACKSYEEKMSLMVKSIEDYLPNLKSTKPVAGMFLMLWLPSNVKGWDFFNRLIEKYRVAIVPGEPFFIDGSGVNTIRLNFSRPKLDDIPNAIKSIAKLLKEDYATTL